VFGIVYDITEQKKVEEEREQLRTQMQMLSHQLVEVQENERRTLARELHDRIGQNLTAININLNIIRSLSNPQQNESTSTRLEESIRLIEETTEFVRDIMGELHPAVLDDYGLAAGIRWYADQFEKRTGIATTVEVEIDNMIRLSAEKEIVLFRIVQEVLTNINKHARAKQVEIKLFRQGLKTQITVQDDGVGFDTSMIHRGWGLRIMRERAASIGGFLQIESSAGNGTRITVEVP
jgi:signal transduction histidine kinase